MTDHSADVVIPAKFQTIIRDFTKDLTTTFPEYSILWKKWTSEDISKKEIEGLFKYCTQVYPERFFDILYQNDDMFKEESEVNTRFLPAVEFRLLYNCVGVTDTTRSAIWKYLQLILMNVVNSVRDKSMFGDAADIFEGVDENELQEKLNKTLEDIGSFFRNLGDAESSASEASGASGASEASEAKSNGESVPNMEDFMNNFAGMGSSGGGLPDMGAFKEVFENMQKSAGDAANNDGGEMPNADDLHQHLKGLFDGKIGSLAKELAEEISHDVEHLFDDGTGGVNPNDVRSTGDLINKIIKNPKKIMSLMKTISGKLQSKMKSGEISEEEIMKEAGELMGKMKGMKGMGGMNDIFKNLAKGMGGGAGGLNIGALQRMQKQMATKERMRAKMEEKAQAQAETKHIERTSDPTRAVFRLGEEDAKPEYSSTDMKPQLNDDELIAMFSKDTTLTKKDTTLTKKDTTKKEKKSKDKKKSNKK